MGNLLSPRHRIHKILWGPSSIFTGLAGTKRLTVGWLYVEIERLSPHELLCAVGLDMFVYVYDVPYMRVISPICEIDVIGRWLAWLALMQRFDW